MNNKHTILEWFDNNIDTIQDIGYHYYIDFIENKDNWDKIFSDMLKDQFYGIYLDYISEECSFSIALPQNECNTVLDDKLTKLWDNLQEKRN